MERVLLLMVTTIDPSLIEQLEIQGEASQLFLSTENQGGKREQVVKVCFKLASVNDQGTTDEDASSVETNALIQAFFQGFSQTVAVILKENGTNFVKVDKEFHRPIREWTQYELNKRLIKDKITSHLCPRSVWKI